MIQPFRELPVPTNHQEWRYSSGVSRDINDENIRKAYPALVIGAAAKNPPRKRKMSRAAVLGANAFPT